MAKTSLRKEKSWIRTKKKDNIFKMEKLSYSSQLDLLFFLLKDSYFTYNYQKNPPTKLV